MNSHSVSRFVAVLIFVVAGAWAASAAAEQEPGDFGPGHAVIQPIVLAQDGGTVPREIEPEYQPVPPKTPGPYNDEEHDLYTTDYLFGMTRGVAGSTMVPALKVPLFLFTIPLDIIFLPFEAIGGFFG